MSVYMAVPKEDASLSHHGILGQKWGIRRYQNKDGSLTPEGLKRYHRFDSKSFKKEKREQYEKEGRSKLMSRVNASSAKEMAKQYDRTMHSSLKQQARIEQKMSKAKAAGDEKAYSRLVKKWIAAQSQIILADKLAKNIDSNLASYQRHQSSLTMMGPIGGVIDAALPGSYFREILKADGKETSDQAMKDYNKRFKISNASDTKQSTKKESPKQGIAKSSKKNVTDEEAIAAAKKAGLHQGDNYKVYRKAMSGDKEAQKIVKEWESQKKSYKQSPKQGKARSSWDGAFKSGYAKQLTTKAAIDKEVARARKEGTYDMEFLEQNLDCDEMGDPLTGKALSDAYRRYLNL